MIESLQDQPGHSIWDLFEKEQNMYLSGMDQDEVAHINQIIHTDIPDFEITYVVFADQEEGSYLEIRGRSNQRSPNNPLVDIENTIIEILETKLERFVSSKYNKKVLCTLFIIGNR